MKKEEKKSIEVKEESVQKAIGIINKRVLLNGSKTLILVAIVICIYIGINIALQKFILPEYDLTKDKLFSLSDETVSKVENIDKEVTITLMNIPEGAENLSLISTIEKYVALNSNIKYENLPDLSTRKDITETYGIGETERLITITCGENEDILTDYDLYSMDYTTYEYVDLTEEALTNALINTTIGEKPVTYFMTNHIMYESYAFGSFLYEMQTEGNLIEEIDLLVAGEIPEDCEILMITTLKEDIMESEKNMILEYINNGGKIMLLSGPTGTEVEMPNFQAVLDEYGVTLENGLVFEQDMNNMLSGSPNYIVESMLYSSMTAEMTTIMKGCFPNSLKVVVDTDKLEELNVMYEPLIETSENAFLRTDYTIVDSKRTENDGEEEIITIGAYLTKTIDEETESKLIVFGSELFIADFVIEIVGEEVWVAGLYNNLDIALNSIAFLNERENSIIIRKSYETLTYTLTEMEHNVVLAIIYTAPAVVVALGIVVWQVRMHKGNKKKQV